jgi:4-amino-4-deoxy-L-arabinose transferase-like glycosyltransferase
MAAKPFETKIQDLVYNVDVGLGLRLIKSGLYCLGVLIVMLLYTATQFHGLKDAEAMDYGQLGRNLATRRHFITQCVRPVTLWGLIEKSSKRNPMVNKHPDVLHPPLWPMLLAAGFKATGVSFTGENAGGIFPPEQWVIIPLCHLFTLLTGIVMFLLGKRLFDRRIGLLAITMFFLSDTVWSASISGLGISLAVFLVTAAIYAALIAVSRAQEDPPIKSWLVPLGISLALCVLAFLTRYATVVIVPAIALFIGLSLKNRGWIRALIFAAVFLIGVSPWLIRNKIVSGGLFGMAPYTALIGTDSFPEDAFERTLSPRLGAEKVITELRKKAFANFAKYYKSDFRAAGDGLFICLFVTAFFYRFVRPPVHLLRWCLALSMLLLLILASFFGDATARLLVLFWPFIILYGFAFFFILLERLQFRVRLFNLAITALFVVLGALPLILTMMPPRKGFPYPPYHPPLVMNVCKLLQPDEIMCTDMPWATAWYGNRNSLLAPATIDDFYEINDYIRRVSGIYFTQLTMNKPWVKNLLTGPDRTWFPLFENRMPEDFPLPHGVSIPSGTRDQLFLTDRMERLR